MEQRTKNPERVRLGRLGALTVIARGRTNTAPARAAWEAALAAEFEIGPEIDEAERKRRLAAALRVRMARLARARWANKRKAAPAVERPEAAKGGRRDRADDPAAA